MQYILGMVSGGFVMIMCAVHTFRIPVARMVEVQYRGMCDLVSNSLPYLLSSPLPPVCLSVVVSCKGISVGT